MHAHNAPDVRIMGIVLNVRSSTAGAQAERSEGGVGAGRGQELSASTASGGGRNRLRVKIYEINFVNYSLGGRVLH